MSAIWVREALLDAEMTQAELARRMTKFLGREIDRSIVNKIVLGTRKLSGDELLAVEALLRTRAPSREEPQRLSLDDEWRQDVEASRGVEGEAYNPETYSPRIPGAVPEIDIQAGAGEGTVGDLLTLALGGETYSGHKITGEWLFPEEFLTNEIHASSSKTMVIPVKGDSMEPTYRPGDRVMVDLSQKTLTEDTVYVISDGQSAPRIKRLVEVMMSKPRMVNIVSDNPAIADQPVPLSDLTIIGRVVGVVSRR